MHRRLMVAVFVMGAPAFGSGRMDYSVCRWTAEKVDSVIESSLKLPSPSIPTPARGSTPTNPEAESLRFLPDDVLTGVAFNSEARHWPVAAWAEPSLCGR
jgi:hypothetical protein